MAGRNCADIVFCIDASGSMQPAIDGIQKHINNLLEGLKQDAQIEWDLRFDFLAFHDSDDGVHYYKTVNCQAEEAINGLYREAPSQKLFTTSLQQFKTALTQIEVEGQEMHLLALDIALDFPWREADTCHRVVVLISDEAVETGVFVEEQMYQLPNIIEKVNKKRVKLFIVAPESAGFYHLSAADRCEYTALENDSDGLTNVDFSEMLRAIGKSVSVSNVGDTKAMTEPLPCYDQLQWSACSNVNWGTDS